MHLDIFMTSGETFREIWPISLSPGKRLKNFIPATSQRSGVPARCRHIQLFAQKKIVDCR
jgi:hypothetical protein